MSSSLAANSRPTPGRRGRGLPAWAALLALSLALASCTLPGASTPTPAPGVLPSEPANLPDRCRNDGAVQTWLLLPLDAEQSALLAAYQARQVVEFHATVIGQDDSPALAPHRRFILREAAEGRTLLLDYQGDPPPLVQGQRYRFVAWADLVEGDVAPAAGARPDDPRLAIPASRGYELQVFDPAGLLFLGQTDVLEPDEALGLRLDNPASACPALPAPQNACVESRQVLPLTVHWNDLQATLYPGDETLLAHEAGLYSVTLFRSRRVTYADPPCADYHEHQRSLRIDRIEPLPALPVLPPITGTITATLPTITVTIPITLPPPPDVPLP
jgi:hypothetical protein